MSEIQINDDIPRTMTRAGLMYLGHLAQSVPRNGLIVEVGPLFGSSTWVLAKNAHPSVRVITIDTWEPQNWITSLEAKWPGCRPYSRSAFDFYTRDCENVTAVQGMSPEVMKDWNEPVDLFFDDATHGDPGFSESLEFYVPKLVPGGIAAGDDFASGWPNIVTGVSRLAEEWKTRPEIIGRVWAMVKPGANGRAQSVYAKAGPYSSHDIAVSVRQRSGEVVKCLPGSWGGHLHQQKSINAVRLDWAIQRKDKLSGVFQVQGSRSQVSAWAPFGEWAEVDGAVTSLRAHLVGPADPGMCLSYQACCLTQSKGKGKRVATRNTRAFRDGAWITLDAAIKPVGISALHCYVERRGSRSAAA
jgi:predicted O-methyltransferase YrrM